MADIEYYVKMYSNNTAAFQKTVSEIPG